MCDTVKTLKTSVRNILLVRIAENCLIYTGLSSYVQLRLTCKADGNIMCINTARAWYNSNVM